MQHSPEFVHEDVGSVGFTISPDEPGSDDGYSRFKTALRDAADFLIGTPSCPSPKLGTHLKRRICGKV
jgi:hypothetical protein